MQSMRKAPSGSSRVFVKATFVAFTTGASGIDNTNFFVMLRAGLKVGLWTLTSVLYSPGVRPIDSASVGMKTRPPAGKHIHFAV